MADTRAQRQAAEWVISEWLPKQFGVSFRTEPVRLRPGGDYRFDAVSEDGAIVVAISTSAAKTSSGKAAVGKMNKIRADMFFLSMTSARYKVMVLTEEDMFGRCIAEKENGRIPDEIQLTMATLPAALADDIRVARELASAEVSPR
jgi:hypothetical protein